MNVLHVKLPSFLPITETFIYSQLRHLSRYRPLVLTCKRENEARFPWDDIFLFDWNKVLDPAYMKNLAANLKTLHDPKLVHAHFGDVGVACVALSEKMQVPLIVSFYGWDASLALRMPELGKNIRMLFQKAARLVALSQDMADRMTAEGCPSEKIALIRVGIDLTQFNFRPRRLRNMRSYQILTVARFVEKKGLDYLFRAIARVATACPHITVVLAGSGPLRSKLEGLRDQLRLDSVIEIRGEVGLDEYRRLLCESDLFVLPSVTAADGDAEGTPAVLLEAQACGLPVVSTFHAGIPEIVQDGVAGFLVPERDEDKLAEKILFLINNPGCCESFGLQGRRFVEKNHDVVQQTEKLEALYGELVL